jgi:hypothetical protein
VIFFNPYHQIGPCRFGKQPENLLDACLHWTDRKGGTIHDFLPHIFWGEGKRPSFHDRVPVFHLWLGELGNLRESTFLGWYQGPKKTLPAIAPDMLIHWESKTERIPA